MAYEWPTVRVHALWASCWRRGPKCRTCRWFRGIAAGPSAAPLPGLTTGEFTIVQLSQIRGSLLAGNQLIGLRDRQPSSLFVLVGSPPAETNPEV
eukprot:scaffold7378_cov410-Prasinococcus_capsulatus_cf.AAC.15